MPIQSNWDFGIGPAGATKYTCNIQPVIPKRKSMKRRIPATVVLSAAAVCASVRAQDLEPRTYSVSPIGLHFPITGYGHTNGSILL